jgi:hypothetical protein
MVNSYLNQDWKATDGGDTYSSLMTNYSLYKVKLNDELHEVLW